MKWSDFSHKPLAPLTIILSLVSISGIILSTLAIVGGLLGILFVYLYPGRPYSPPPPQNNIYVPPTVAHTPTITPTYILPTFMGPQKVQPVGIYTHTPTPTLSPTPVITIDLVSLTTPIGLGQRATLTIKTAPGQRCLIAYYTPLGNLSDAQDLISQDSDASGICSWTWIIGTMTTLGTGDITVRVGDVTAKYEIEIIDG